MKKNTAGQKVGAQLVDTAGAAFTGSVTVYITGDAGTQAVGSVSSGACTHEGNGYHTYAPSQAETNYDLIAFTFIGTGAIPVTVQRSTQVDANIISGTATSDITKILGTSITEGAAGRLAAAFSAFLNVASPVLTVASVNQSGDVYPKVDTEIADIKAKTDNLPSDPADASVVAGLIAAVEAKVDIVDTVADTILTKVDTEIADIQSRLPATLVSGRMDSYVGAMGANTFTASALATDAVAEIQSGLATSGDVTESDVVLCRYGGAFTSSAGTEFRASAWLERNGQIVVLASGTCTLTFRENASGSNLFTVTDSAPNAQGIFELVKTSPGFTSDRLQIATVEIDDGVNPVWITRHPVQIR